MTNLYKASSIYKSSAVVGFWTLCSRIMGFIRDILFAAILGSGPIADAFILAFRIPNLFRKFLNAITPELNSIKFKIGPKNIV